MSRRIAEAVNALPETSARADLAKCCASKRWAEQMASARPFGDDAQVFAAADRIWNGLTSGDWLEAFAAHPRIGGRAIDDWARQEQAGAAGASDGVRQELADGNLQYEERFGHVFLICATGLSADKMLAELKRRMLNDPITELEIAAAEQAKITRLRLEKLATP